LSDLGVVGLRVPAEREITAYIDVGLHREHRSPADRPLWMNEQQLALARAIDDGTVIDDGALPTEVSEGAAAELRAFEEARARADQLQQEVDRLQDELKSQQQRLEETAAASDELMASADRQLQQLSQSRSWRLAWGANAARHRLVGADRNPASPLDRATSLIESARRRLADGAAPPGDDPHA
jgi:hypothetical protein